MSTKANILKKRYNALKNKNYLFYFHKSSLKANESRKLRRSLQLNNINLVFLPSAFAFTSIKSSHGPSMYCGLSPVLGFTQIALVNQEIVTCIYASGKGGLKIYSKENYENPKNQAKKLNRVLGLGTLRKEQT